MKTLGIIGCGNLAQLVAKSIVNGILTDYNLIGAYSRNSDKTQNVADIINKGVSTGNCKVCNSTDELIAMRPDYIVESASPEAFRDFALKALSNGISIIVLSIGGLADAEFYKKVEDTARKNQTKVHLVSGAIGGFDVLRTASMMYPSTVTFETEKGPNPLRNSSVYTESLQTEEKLVFEGNAVEAIALFPRQVNVAVAASLASVGPKNTKVSITSKPNYVGDNHRITLKNEEINAVIDIYSKTPKIAGWSVVNTLRNLASPIVF